MGVAGKSRTDGENVCKIKKHRSITGRAFCFAFKAKFALNSECDIFCRAFFRPLHDVRVTGCRFRVFLPQGFLHDTQIFRRGIQIRAATVAEDMAGVSFLLETRLLQALVHDEPDAIPRKAS